MKHPSYTIEQAECIAHVQQKVALFFDAYPVTAHGYDHVSRVARNAVDIALHESPDDVFITELGAWLHDIGRVPEHTHNPLKKSHHELSYDLLRTWMKDDLVLYSLTHAQKIELLYGVRYHWNNAADKYKSAVMLRDADKLDVFGDIGIARVVAFAGDNEQKLNQDLRFLFDIHHHIVTDRAKQILVEYDLMTPVYQFYDRFLRSKIEPITLE